MIVLSMKKKLDGNKYKNKVVVYSEALKEQYPEPYEIFVLSRTKKLNFIELILDTFIAPSIGPVSTADKLGDLSPYYLVKKDDLVKERELKRKQRLDSTMSTPVQEEVVEVEATDVVENKEE